MRRRRRRSRRARRQIQQEVHADRRLSLAETNQDLLANRFAVECLRGGLHFHRGGHRGPGRSAIHVRLEQFQDLATAFASPGFWGTHRRPVGQRQRIGQRVRGHLGFVVIEPGRLSHQPTRQEDHQSRDQQNCVARHRLLPQSKTCQLESGTQHRWGTGCQVGSPRSRTHRLPAGVNRGGQRDTAAAGTHPAADYDTGLASCSSLKVNDSLNCSSSLRRFSRFAFNVGGSSGIDRCMGVPAGFQVRVSEVRRINRFAGCPWRDEKRRGVKLPAS